MFTTSMFARQNIFYLKQPHNENGKQMLKYQGLQIFNKSSKLSHVILLKRK